MHLRLVVDNTKPHADDAVAQGRSVAVFASDGDYCSVCIDPDTPAHEAVAEANRIHPAPDGGVWKVAVGECFAGGESNPCECLTRRGFRHYLLRCH